MEPEATANGPHHIDQGYNVQPLKTSGLEQIAGYSLNETVVCEFQEPVSRSTNANELRIIMASTVRWISQSTLGI